MKKASSSNAQSAQATPCPCTAGQDYAACCGRYHAGLPAPTAEALMRSRYSAYVLQLEPYLLATWANETRPETLALQNEPQPKWIDLTIRSSAEVEDTGTVAFIARYKVGGRAYKLAEESRFRREQGRWYYIDGTFTDK